MQDCPLLARFSFATMRPGIFLFQNATVLRSFFPAGGLDSDWTRSLEIGVISVSSYRTCFLRIILCLRFIFGRSNLGHECPSPDMSFLVSAHMLTTRQCHVYMGHTELYVFFFHVSCCSLLQTRMKMFCSFSPAEKLGSRNICRLEKKSV